MAMITISKGDLVVIREEKYEIRRRLPDGNIQLEQLVSGMLLCLSDEDLAQKIADGDARIQRRQDLHRLKSGSFRSGRSLENVSEKEKKKALRRHGYLSELRKRGLENVSKERLMQGIVDIATMMGDTHPPSVAAIYNWRKMAGDKIDIRKLCDAKRGAPAGTSRLHPAVVEIIDTHVRITYMSKERPSMTNVFTLICNEIRENNKLRDSVDQLGLPSYSAVRHYIRTLDEYDVVESRFGKAAAELRFAPVGEGPKALAPLSLVELDHTKMDLFVVDANSRLPIGRPWLVIAIDRYSRYPVGVHISFDPPSVQTVAQCLKNMILPKGYVKKCFPGIHNEWECFGIAFELNLDRAMENMGVDLDVIALDLGMGLRFSPRKKPWFKGVVERYFRTVNESLLEKLPGKTFNNFLTKGEYDPAKNAVITYDDLLFMVHKWIIDIYAQSPHRGLKKIPAVAWREGVKERPVRFVDSIDELDVLLGQTETRVLTRKGIEFENLRYSADEVVLWLRDYEFKSLSQKTKTGYKVKIKYDPTDISCLWVFDPRSEQYMKMKCTNEEYANGISLWQHQVVKSYISEELKCEVDQASLDRARADLQEMVDALIAGRGRRRPRNSTVQRGARFLGIGRTALCGTGEELPVFIPKETAVPEKNGRNSQSKPPKKSKEEMEKKPWKDDPKLCLPCESDAYDFSDESS